MSKNRFCIKSKIKQTIRNIIFLAVFFSSHATAASPILMQERTALFEKRHYQSLTGFASMDYYLLEPQNYDPAKKYPLVVTLHGASGHSWGAYALADPNMRQRYPAFVLVPHAPKISGWGVEAYTDLAANPSDHVVKIIHKLEKEFSIDKNKIYLTGYSMGGFGTFDMVAQNPDLFAASAPLCGGGDPREVSKVLETPMWFFHGTQDRNIPVDKSRSFVKAIKDAGGKKVFYTELPNSQHNIWTEVYASSNFWDWMFSQSK